MNSAATEILIRIDPETGKARAVEYVDANGKTSAAERREKPEGTGPRYVLRAGAEAGGGNIQGASVAAAGCTWYCIPDGQGGCYWVCI